MFCSINHIVQIYALYHNIKLGYLKWWRYCGIFRELTRSRSNPKCVCDSAVISESEVKISVSDSAVIRESEVRFKPVITQ